MHQEQIYLIIHNISIKHKFESKSKTNNKMEVIRIPNIANYTQEEIDGDLILTPKRIYITEDEIASTNVTNSTIFP